VLSRTNTVIEKIHTQIITCIAITRRWVQGVFNKTIRILISISIELWKPIKEGNIPEYRALQK